MVIFYFLSVQMYLCEFGECKYDSRRTRSFSVYIVLVYIKGLCLCSSPLCHDVLHSICHIKIKLHLTYSAIYKRKSLQLILIGPHLISSFFYHSSLHPISWSCLLIHQIIFILHSCIPISSYTVNQLVVAFHLVQP